jgi:hypothetical protein
MLRASEGSRIMLKLSLGSTRQGNLGKGQERGADNTASFPGTRGGRHRSTGRIQNGHGQQTGESRPRFSAVKCACTQSSASLTAI